MVDDDEFAEAVTLVRFGFRWHEIWQMHPIERRAALYVIAQIEGSGVDWTTGKIIHKNA